MIQVAVLGGGNIGHAVAALAGSQPGVSVALWSRRAESRRRVTLRAFGAGGIYAIAEVALECSLRRAINGADVVILAMPVHARLVVLQHATDHLRRCKLLLAWEGMGRFPESIREVGLSTELAAGLQKSPILCRTRVPFRAVEILGVRSEVVMATVDPSGTRRARAIVEHLLPFRLVPAPLYACVSLSPSNPLIHPARLYACSQESLSRRARFYADWSDAASLVLLRLHRELKSVREALGISSRFVRTLADRSVSPARVTREMQSASELEEVRVPLRRFGGRYILDTAHRFFREDIGEGLRYIAALAARAGVTAPTANEICAWYDRRDHNSCSDE